MQYPYELDGSSEYLLPVSTKPVSIKPVSTKQQNATLINKNNKREMILDINQMNVSNKKITNATNATNMECKFLIKKRKFEDIETPNYFINF
jgi:hypothetical protein